MLIPWHAEDEAGTMLGEIRLGLVDLGFHRDGAFPPVQAALHRVGDTDLQSALLTATQEETEESGRDGMCPDPRREGMCPEQGRERGFVSGMHPAAS